MKRKFEKGKSSEISFSKKKDTKSVLWQKRHFAFETKVHWEGLKNPMTNPSETVVSTFNKKNYPNNYTQESCLKQPSNH